MSIYLLHAEYIPVTLFGTHNTVMNRKRHCLRGAYFCVFACMYDIVDKQINT